MNAATLRSLSIFSIGLCLFSAPLKAEDGQDAPQIPYSYLSNYEVSYEYEMLESMRMKRLWLRGPIDIMMDPIEDHIQAPTQGRASVRFTVRNATDFSVDLLSFPKSAFGHNISNEILNHYLQGVEARHSPQQGFQIEQRSEFTETGRADFRILGQKAYHIRYSFLKNGKRYGVAENWIEKDDTIHMVRVSAPMDRLDLHFKNTAMIFTSMAEQ